MQTYTRVLLLLVVLVLVVLVFSRLVCDSNGFHPALYTKAIVHYMGRSDRRKASSITREQKELVYPNMLQSRLATTEA